jgi:replicative DNA helicase
MTDTPIAPHSVEAEEAVIGSVLLNPDVLAEVAPFVTSPDFFIVRHRWIWDAITRVHERREAIDYLTVVNELEAHGHLEEAGGPAYITYLVNNTPTSIHAETYARLVQRTAYRRRLLEAAGEVARLAHDQTLELEPLQDLVRAAVDGAAGNVAARDVVTVFEAISQHIDAVHDAIENPDTARGIRTGYLELDATYDLLKPRRLITVAAHTGMGKTSFMLNLAAAAMDAGHRAAFFSLEMGADEVVDRLMANVTRLSPGRFRSGKMDENEQRLYLDAAEAKAGAWFGYIDDTSAASLPALRAKCQRLAHGDGLDIAFVDYVQLVRSGSRSSNDVEELTKVTQGLKAIARELGIVVVTASQFRKDDGGARCPTLDDLRGSGSISHDSDAVLIFHRDRSPNAAKSALTEVHVAKFRNGPTGVVKLWFEAPIASFLNPEERQAPQYQRANGR